ncbi:hypothetical protein CEXT_694191 [Caerostris extrusa]|uniref:Uncharacterized protein n=1 Tax=Caerostris extrusa TaxID=172846 RepID=A0AAV4WNF4_CAEEX|nr:hypothetical protein CEXT_694191 [Caerostris extrusa]
MHQTDSGLDGCEISPIRANRKYQVTPKRLTRKTSRRDQGIDVHSSCSTPTQSPKTGIRNYSSPSSSFPYSQENHPDVVWDYSSPKLPKGSRKKEIKLTIQELLENLNQCQVPECNNNVKSAQYIKLLENWMSNQKKITNIKKVQQKNL